MNKQTILSILLIILLAAIGYVWFQFGGTTSPLDGQENQEALANFTDLRRLKEIQFDTSILQDPRFQILEEFSRGVDISGITPGRANPFVSF
jgi:hypothetical protein